MSGFLKKVLLATDGSEDATAATRAAADLSKRLGAELYVIHAWEKPPEYSYPGVPRSLDTAAFFQRHAEEVLEREREHLAGLEARVTEAFLELGRAADGILDFSEHIGVDLVVIGSRGHGAFRRVALGSVSEEVVHHASCPVVVVRPGERTWPPERIVVGDDGSEDASRAGALAAGLGDLLEVPMVLVRAYHQPPAPTELASDQVELYERMIEQNLEEAERSLERRAEELEEVLGVRPEIRVSTGNPAMALDEVAGEDESCLIVVGSRGLGAVRRMALGSVSTKVLRAAEGPVLVYPHSTP
ncbi:MAG: universal stress protein [Rubrobacteraceae bacterium]